MRVVVAILAALGILILLANGGESDISGREREGFEEGPAQALVAAPAVDPAPVITIVEEQGRDRLPAETLAQLTEVRDLLTGAAGQSPEQAQAGARGGRREARWGPEPGRDGRQRGA